MSRIKLYVLNVGLQMWKRQEIVYNAWKMNVDLCGMINKMAGMLRFSQLNYSAKPKGTEMLGREIGTITSLQIVITALPARI